MTKPITDPHPINFKHNVRPILPGSISKKEYQDMDPETIWKKTSSKVGRKDGSVDYSQLLPRPIQLYRWWFLFLKLALELERNNVRLIIRHPHPKNGNKENSEKIRVNKKKYNGWDLDQVLTQRFDKWWKNHNSLFVDEGTRILKTPKDWDNNPNIIHLRVDKRRKIEDVRRDIDRIFGKEIGRKNRNKIPNKFPITGKPRPLELQNKYNALIKVMDRENLTAEQIFEGKYFRGVHNHQRGDDGKILYSSSLSKIVTPGKELLLSVCDGYFSKRPK